MIMDGQRDKVSYRIYAVHINIPLDLPAINKKVLIQRNLHKKTAV